MPRRSKKTTLDENQLSALIHALIENHLYRPTRVLNLAGHVVSDHASRLDDELKQLSECTARIERLAALDLVPLVKIASELQASARQLQQQQDARLSPRNILLALFLLTFINLAGIFWSRASLEGRLRDHIYAASRVPAAQPVGPVLPVERAYPRGIVR